MDRAISTVASAQHGLVTRQQLESAGLSRAQIQHRVGRGRLLRVYHGVYAVGHQALSPEGRMLAATLAIGEGAVLGHRSAAELWGLLDHRGLGAPTHVIAPTRNGRARFEGIIVHRPVLTPGPAEVTTRRGVPVTTPDRTIKDLRRREHPAVVRRATRQAEAAGFAIVGSITERTRSDIELDFLALCRRNRLPEPVVNSKVGRHEVDFLWQSHKLIAEVDSYKFHRGRQAFTDDRQRDVDLSLSGYSVHRFSDELIATRPRQVATAIRLLLESRS